MKQHFEVIVIGGSYAGLQAALTLGRALKHTLVIDSGAPCNRFTPHAHNFLTHDGAVPGSITQIAKTQLAPYTTVQFLDGKALTGRRTDKGFEIITAAGQLFSADRLLFATGVRDLLPDVPGLAACWGKSVLHCPFCHGFELRQLPTGILASLDAAITFGKLIRNWTGELTLFTNGPATPSPEQETLLNKLHIRLETATVQALLHQDGQLEALQLEDGRHFPLKVLYARLPAEPHCDIPAHLGCKLTADGLLEVDAVGRTSVPGVLAAGDNCTPMRSLAIAVARGLTAAAAIMHDMVGNALN